MAGGTKSSGIGRELSEFGNRVCKHKIYRIKDIATKLLVE